jgi:hypothetical protein
MSDQVDLDNSAYGSFKNWRWLKFSERSTGDTGQNSEITIQEVKIIHAKSQRTVLDQHIALDKASLCPT